MIASIIAASRLVSTSPSHSPGPKDHDAMTAFSSWESTFRTD